MARILDKDTRLIDVDFGPVNINIARLPNELFPDGTPGNQGTISGSGEGSIVNFRADGLYTGSFIQYQRVDLSYMTENGEAMQPVEVSVQRTSVAPSGTHENGNNYDAVKEYLFVLSAPLGDLSTITNYLNFDNLGLDMGSSGTTQAQTIYAEQRTYAWNSNFGATIANGELVASNGTLNSTFGEPQLTDVITWGSLSTIVGPNLHCYRVMVSQLQTFDAPSLIFANVGLAGFTSLNYPPLNVTFLCKDPNFTEGQYLTRVYNAMNKTAIGEPTFD